ncbi:MAG: YIP1 family protein [Rhabdochlamydiaceae bacterium]|nr:YIP1 family protein [Candidatus Amphrikana amoebophyrae]
MLKLNPWLSIWLKPRDTIRAIKEYDPKHRFHVMCLIYGFLWMLSMSQTISLGHFYGVPMIVIVSLILAWPVGYIMISVSSLLFLWVGKLFKGKGRYVEVRAAVAWANAPSLITIITWIILMAAYGSRLFMADKGAMDAEFGLVDVLFVVQVIVAVWSMVILIFGLSGAQGFSGGRAFGSFILVLCIWIIFTILVMYIIAYCSQPAALALLESF